MVDHPVAIAFTGDDSEKLLNREWWKVFDVSNEELQRTVGFIMTLLLDHHQVSNGAGSAAEKVLEAEAIDTPVQFKPSSSMDRIVSVGEESAVHVAEDTPNDGTLICSLHR